jgi:uracil-DNA glycosylase
MFDGETHDLQAEAESLIGWWRDAGVDILIDEEPRNWLADAAPPVAHPPKAPSTAPGLPPVPIAVPMPTALPAFLAWLATDVGALADYPVRQRLAPEGDPCGAVMVVTDVPERGDAETGHLLSGEVGDLFDRMVGAWKIDRTQIYLTAMAPARPASGRIEPSSLQSLGPVLSHHIRLAAPKKLWLMGEAASRAILGMNVADATRRLHVVNYDGVTVQAIATLHPRVLLREPKSKARVWEDMQRLIGPELRGDLKA